MAHGAFELRLVRRHMVNGSCWYVVLERKEIGGEDRETGRLYN